ncbi:MAG: siderophore-interacting protein [Bacteroidota bacterium]
MAKKTDKTVEQNTTKPKSASSITVRKIERITPKMQRIHFFCEKIEQYINEDKIHVKLILPPEGFPPQDWLVRPNDEPLHIDQTGYEGRKYTIRKLLPEQKIVVIDFALHEYEEFCPGADWAAHAREGWQLGMLGPGGRGIAPADWYLMGGDESALPAIARILEQLPGAAAGEVFLEVQNEQERQELQHPEQMQIHWLYRKEVHAKESTLLYDALVGAELQDPERSFVWAAGEVRSMVKLREYVKAKYELPKAQQLISGYWRA